MKRLPITLPPVVCCFIYSIFCCTLYAQSLDIATFSPFTGSKGTLVSITGTGFSTVPDGNIVRFGPVRGEVIASGPTQITVRVPIGAASGPITVTSGGLTAASARSFIHTFAGIGRIIDGVYAAPTDIPSINDGPGSCAIADLDGDGSSDLAVHHQWGNSLGLYRSLGPVDTLTSSQFSSDADLGTGFLPGAVYASDITGDGRIDLVSIPSFSPLISVFVNTSTIGTIEFTSRIDVPTFYDGTKYSCVQDIDHDGRPDIVVCISERRTIDVYRNTSSPTGVSFQWVGGYDCPAGVIALACADLDGDKRPDLVTANAGNHYLSIRKNFSVSGAVDFGDAFQVNVEHAASSITEIDADSDGRTDLVMGAASDSSLLLLKNLSAGGNIAFDRPLTLELSGIPQRVTNGDIDGDGKPDLVVTVQDSTGIDLLENESVTEPAFGHRVHLQLESPAGGVLVSDISGDETPEIIVTDGVLNRIRMFQNFSNRFTQFVTNAGWNLLSIPRAPIDPSSRSVLRRTLTNVYGFTGTEYFTVDTVRVGTGYWALYSMNDTIRVYGRSIESFTLSVPAGNRWLIFGSVTEPIATARLAVDPPNAILSRYYGYDGTQYTVPAMIEPGKGYWFYALQPCTITVGP